MRAQIVMATHNPRPDLFRRQISSLLAQTESDWRCLVLDDVSTDRAAVTAALDDPRFEVLPAHGHLGPYRAFEHLLQKAHPSMPVFLCDQDDYWHPDKLRTLLEVPGSAFSAMRVVDDNGHLVRERFLEPPTDLSPAGLLLMNCVSGAALKISPQVRRAALPFPAPDLRGWHDQWLAAVAASQDGLHYVSQPYVDYTQHSGQVAGDGLRRVTARRIRAFAHRPDLRSRAQWVRLAADRLQEVSGSDPELAAIAAGRFRDVLRGHDVPWQRALLLRAGSRLAG